MAVIGGHLKEYVNGLYALRQNFVDRRPIIGQNFLFAICHLHLQADLSVWCTRIGI
jgi:hypothetical protein